MNKIDLHLGSDEMNRPQRIALAIKNVLEAPFLTEPQKRNIFYNNAARLFQIKLQRVEPARFGILYRFLKIKS